jgi:tetratricopeptide (TPR) repeat protein
MHFPFIPTKTRDLVESLMQGAINYQHFMELLCDEVCTKEFDETTIFLAYIHALNLWDFEQLNRLSLRYANLPNVKPLFLLARSAIGKIVDYDEVLDAAFEILLDSEEHWVSLEMFRIIYKLGSRKLSWTTKDEEALELAEHLVGSDSQMTCYLPIIHREKWIRDPNAQKYHLEKALKLASKNDDKHFVGFLLRDLAWSMQSTDTHAALEHLIEAKEVFESLGDTSGFSWIQNSLGHVYMIRGEFNAAFDFYLSSYETREKQPLPYDAVPHNIALVYNLLGDGENAFEWSKMSTETFSSRPMHIPYGHMQQAWALVNLGIANEAMSVLDTARELVLKTGSLHKLGFYWFILGLIEREEGDAQSALDSLSQALEIGLRFAYNECLYQLAKTELLIYGNDPSAKASKFWLNRFEDKASENELPGYYALYQILKAKYCIIQEKYSEAQEFVRVAERFSRKPSMEYLQDEVTVLKKILE